MDRIKIDLPEQFEFVTTIAVRISDVNYGGHAGNDSFLRFMHEARLQYLKQFGYSETNIEGLGMIMADAAIEFKGELFYEDSISVYITAKNFSKYGFDLFYLIQKNNDAKTIAAKAKTAMLCFNYQTRKIASLPEAAKNKLNNLQK